MAVPKDLQRLVAEIDGWLDLRCPDKALALLPPLLDRPDSRTIGLWLRVRAMVNQKQYRQALRDLDELRATQYDPEWLELTEAWCRKRVQDLPGAIACMERLLARDPRSAIGHFNLGCYLALAGQQQRALDEVTLACGIDSSFRELVLTEPDLDSLHRDSNFRALATGVPDNGDSPAAEGPDGPPGVDDLLDEDPDADDLGNDEAPHN